MHKVCLVFIMSCLSAYATCLKQGEYLILDFNAQKIERDIGLFDKSCGPMQIKEIIETINQLKEMRSVYHQDAIFYNLEQISPPNYSIKVDNDQHLPSFIKLANSFEDFDYHKLGKQIILADFSGNQRHIIFRIEKKAMVYQATREIKPNDQMSLEDSLILKEHVSSNPNDFVLPDKSSLPFMMPARHIKEGMIVTNEHLRHKNIVQFNQIVEFSYNSPGIIISGKAIAKQNGKINDLIRIENIETKKNLIGKITDYNKVIIQ
jgi:flagella basal body P-ring formation protein FlgA